jgi:hypothetical protein
LLIERLERGEGPLEHPHVLIAEAPGGSGRPLHIFAEGVAQAGEHPQASAVVPEHHADRLEVLAAHPELALHFHRL